ncbi:SusC/RagA family TonB-linked outer membrane protein [Chitinophaga nivalis]|uniref:SusC/RagA family TonB-linked outer membrane protein n=1 Tax=Chitinophaga nivalis TaxID=2991709 RepID=A0ABT3IPF1_9BACT|nr:SusC/RagA family TonB-linked outer membrane protein [Chitinophaga nivalis]MCW3464644.1 SusC/RagA family TonB-linked outer membrane protein [Chitinophaga nivalis]MCW3485665.1 SusC/RagA family TonB-linked outer membrane protein [Chitinophaga nivalis]
MKRISLMGACFAVLLSFLLLSWVQVAEGLKDKIDVGFRQTKVLQVLQYLEKNTRLKFSYNLDDLEQLKPLTIDKKERTVETLLQEISHITTLQFKITDEIILVKVPSAIVTTQQPAAPQQEKPVTGVIQSATGEKLPGVSVKVKGSTKGVLTDASGAFRFTDLPKDAILEISFIGFNSQEVAVNGQSVLSVTLETSTKVLDQVVVVGYGTQSKRNVSSAITSVKGSEIANVPSNNPVNALQGRVAGLTVVNSGGAPGAMADIKLRGVSTFGEHQPLFVIDGVPGDPYYLNNNDIASIEVLKDGAAASIYGSQSANGVILVTTKKGKKGAPKMEFNSYYSVVNPVGKMHLLDGEGYLKVHRMMYDNAPDIDPSEKPAYLTQPVTANTNWRDEVTQQGSAENYSLNVTGGGEYFNYGLSGNITKEIGTMIGTDFRKKSLRARNEYKKGRLTIETNLVYAETQLREMRFSLKDAYFQSPLLPVYDSKEKYGYALQINELPKFQNPVGASFYNDNYNKTQYFSGNARMSVQLIKGMKFVTNLSLANSNSFDYAYHPPYRANQNDPVQPFARLTDGRTNRRERLMENLLYYDRSFGKHSLNLLAGYTAQEIIRNRVITIADGKSNVYTVKNGQVDISEVPGGFLDPNFTTMDGAKGGLFNATGSRPQYNRLSTLGRVNYSYDNKYLVQLSVRRDGSSKFGENRRYGVFPSASVGWNMHSESFMQRFTWLDLLKVRASYGELGNEISLKEYDHQALIDIYNYMGGGSVQGGGTVWPGGAAWELKNKDLRWETSVSKNIGIDFGVLKNLTGSFNYFNNVTNDLLIRKELAPSAGLNNPVMNVGRISNKGWELELTYSDHHKDFNYSVTGTVSQVKNKVLALANEGQKINGVGLKYGSGPIPNTTMVGTEIGAFYLYTADGIFQSDEEAANYKNANGVAYQPDAKAGDIRFIDSNGDGIINAKDKTYKGSGFPKLEYGLNMNFSYKGFDLQLFWQGVAGNKIYNGNKYEQQGMDAGRNFDVSTLRAWTPDNRNTDVPRAVLGDPNGNTRESTRFLEKGDYLRLKTLQLGYAFAPHLLQRASINRLRIYASAQNLLTFTKYSGMDPEVGRAEVLNTGLDLWMYPQNKVFMAGLQLEF